jgi:lysophospholipase L1-like esterase
VKSKFLSLISLSKNMKMKIQLLSIIFTLKLSLISAQLETIKFDFGTDKPAKGYIGINSTSFYNKQIGYGFLKTAATILDVKRKTGEKPASDFCTADKPFYFKIDLPEGNYDIKVILGDSEGASLTTIKVENRRLMLEKVKNTEAGISEQNFTVNIRNAAINNSKDSVKLKPREYQYLHWDNALTIEFCDENPKIAAIEITPNTQAATVFLAGNSTVVDQYIEPFTAWGQMLPRFFTPLSISIANHAESGESLRSFIGEKRLKKVLSLMKTGDYLFIEFAHNDQKQKDLDPFVGYKDLLKKFIGETRKKGGKPVLVTSMHRRSFDSLGKIINTLGDFPEAMRQTAKEENVPLIDLNAMSKTLWEALGAENAKKAFVHVAANTFLNQEKAIADDTHFSNYGAYLLALCIVEGIKQNVPELAPFLERDLPKFDPSVPLSFEMFKFPMGASMPLVKPDGN